jgi:hypothetical protein
MGIVFWKQHFEHRKEQEALANPTEAKKKMSVKDIPLYIRIGIFGTGVALLFGFNAILIPFFISGLKRYGKIPYLPTAPEQIRAMFRMLPLKELQGIFSMRP